ncbi:MAG: hypothetical protein ABIW79_03305 [Gemmatimonas sp.]
MVQYLAESGRERAQWHGVIAAPFRFSVTFKVTLSVLPAAPLASPAENAAAPTVCVPTVGVQAG